jgi:hypothetical protein
LNYIQLVADLREIADHYESSAAGCPLPMQRMYQGNAQMYRTAAQSIEELTQRLVRQACYFEEIEARDEE